ncbi:MAG: hypothetical protein ACRCXL_04050 [Dermatophilaceae bacterium]
MTTTRREARSTAPTTRGAAQRPARGARREVTLTAAWARHGLS